MRAQEKTPINRLLDDIKVKHGLKTDADLCRKIDVFPPVVAKTRSGALPVGPNMILRLHETFDIPVKEIRAALAA